MLLEKKTSNMVRRVALLSELIQRQIESVATNQFRTAERGRHLFCSMLDDCSVVTDCHTVSKSGVDFRYKCAVTAAVCQVAGWEFRLVGEPDPVWAANLRWLAGYRHPRFADPVASNVVNRCRSAPAMAVSGSRMTCPAPS